MNATVSAYSSGRPSRGGNGTCLPSDACTSSGMPAIIGVMNMPGAMVLTRMPNCANSRAKRQHHADDAAFRGRIGRLADLPLECRNRRGADDNAALAVVVRIVELHDGSRFLGDVVGADEVDLNHPVEVLGGPRPVTTQCASGGRNAGTVHGERNRRP